MIKRTTQRGVPPDRRERAPASRCKEKTGTGILFAAHPTYQLRVKGGEKRGDREIIGKKDRNVYRTGINSNILSLRKLIC
jgi:hypothetical protein